MGLNLGTQGQLLGSRKGYVWKHFSIPDPILWAHGAGHTDLPIQVIVWAGTSLRKAICNDSSRTCSIVVPWSLGMKFEM